MTRRADLAATSTLLSFALAVTICAAAGSASDAAAIVSSRDDTCGYRIRAARPDELRLVDRNPVLGAPPNANDAPGPGTLRAMVKTDSLHHPHIYIVESARGASRRLCSGCMPRWFPDGKWIAFNGWQSRERPNVIRVDESVHSSDPWFYDLEGHGCRLTTTPMTDEEDVGWINDQLVRFTLLDWYTPADSVASIYRVIELLPR